MSDDSASEPPKERRISRRGVLQGIGAVAVTGGLATGGFALHDRWLRGRDALSTIPDHRVKLPPTAPRMVIARGSDIARNVRATIARFGGMQRFVNAGDTVLIKPNIGWARTPEQAANTHPRLVGELVLACRAAGAKRVIVSDCPVSRSRLAFMRSGIMHAGLLAGAEVLPPEDSRYLTVRISPRLGTWDVLEPFVVATKVINVPVAKHHNLTGVTGGMKNWIGITGKLRLTFHGDLDRSIAELATLMRPTLTVMDASRVLMRNGPQGGSFADVKRVNTVAASVDPIAIDAWACGLFDTPPDKMPGYLALGEGMGLGRIDYRALKPVEIVVG